MLHLYFSFSISLYSDIPAGAAWTKLNVGQYGYYRVNYPLEDWATFSQLMIDDMNALSISDRTSLLNDAFSLAAGNRLIYSTALGLTKYLTNERDLAPWQVTVGSLGYFSDVFYYSKVYPNLIKYERELVDALYNDLGWEDEGDFETKQLRTTILNVACSAGNTDCLTTAGNKFLGWKNDDDFIPPNFRSIVYNYGMKTVGNQETWDWMFDKYMAEQNAQEKLKLMRGLTCSTDAWILYQFIQMAKDISIVREQDYFTLLTYISYNRIGEPLVWDFVRSEWEYLVDRFTLNDRALGKLIPSITSKFSTEQRLKEMNDFFADYPNAGAGENYRDIALETVTNNIKFVAAYTDVINDWLVDNTAK